MHAARLDRSPRLQATLAYLKQRGNAGATTREIASVTQSVAVHSDISELEAAINGCEVDCTFEGVENGRRIYRYRLVSAPGYTAPPLMPDASPEDDEPGISREEALSRMRAAVR